MRVRTVFLVVIHNCVSLSGCFGGSHCDMVVCVCVWEGGGGREVVGVGRGGGKRGCNMIVDLPFHVVLGFLCRWWRTT